MHPVNAVWDGTALQMSTLATVRSRGITTNKYGPSIYDMIP